MKILWNIRVYIYFPINLIIAISLDLYYYVVKEWRQYKNYFDEGFKKLQNDLTNNHTH